MKLYDIAGWFGVTAILLAYLLITTEAVEAKDWVYNMMNLVGAACIVWSSYVKKDYQPVALNVVWLLIALFGLANSIL